jgi:hypothetical protein
VTRYLDLAEYLWLAEQVAGVDAARSACQVSPVPPFN